MNDETKAVAEWLGKIGDAEGHYQKYYDLVDETREFYKDSKSNNRSNKYNIFWSSVETLKPFLYFRQPKFYIERQSKTADKAEKLACQMLEKALLWNLSQFDFDSVIKYARNDFLISGMGIIWEQYKPKFENVPNPLNPDQEIFIKTDEVVESVYLDPRYFIADCNKVGIWEDVSWIARKIFLSKSEAIEVFGQESAALIIDLAKPDDEAKEICVYELWDKISRKVYWLSKECGSKFLKVSEDLFNLQAFFACPKPIFATLTNDSIIPTPDYCLIREMLNELNGINARMKMTMQALKVSGCYDNSFPELAEILSKDVTLVSVNDFTKLRENGGIRGVIDFAPIEQYVTALEQLAVRRQEVVASIFDVTGVSDIMRGNSDASETATAVIKKTNFGTLRNQDRQNDMQRFIRDLLKIKAEIICEYFSDEKLLSFLPDEQKQDSGLIGKAIHILRSEHLRGMVFAVETDAIFNQQEEIDKTISAVKSINEMIGVALSTVTQQPLLLPLYKEMIEAVVATLPKARSFESTLEKVFNDVSMEFENKRKLQEQQMQKQPETDPKIMIEMQKNQLKEKELSIKEKIEMERIALDNKELDTQAAIKKEQFQTERKKLQKGA